MQCGSSQSTTRSSSVYLVGVTNTERITRVSRRREEDRAIISTNASAIFIQDVDPFEESRETLAELVARTGIKLPIGLDVVWVLVLAGQELVAPVIGNPCLKTVLVVEGNRVCTIACAGNCKLGGCPGQGVVERRITVDNGIVQDRAKSGVPEIVRDGKLQPLRRAS